MNSPENNLIVVMTHKEIAALYKAFLSIVEDLRDDNATMLKKVASQTTNDFAQHINYFTPEKYEQIRKRVLDNGNDAARKLTSFLDFFDFNINQSKVEEAARQKRVTTKKVVINAPVSIE